jgi:hypothetical protein
MPNGFWKQDCDRCERKTWWSNSTSKAHCTECPSKYLNQPAGSIIGAKVPETAKDWEIKRANRMDLSLWNTTQERRVTQVDISNEDWAADLFADAPTLPKLEPGQMLCSWCRKVIDATNSLSEKRPVIRVKQEAIEGPNGPELREKVYSRVETVHACSEHYLQIRKPITVRTV